MNDYVPPIIQELMSLDSPPPFVLNKDPTSDAQRALRVVADIKAWIRAESKDGWDETLEALHQTLEQNGFNWME